MGDRRLIAQLAAWKMLSSLKRPRVKGILLDIEGVVCVGSTVLPGSLAAVN
jgi:hypothetical protein